MQWGSQLEKHEFFFISLRYVFGTNVFLETNHKMCTVKVVLYFVPNYIGIYRLIENKVLFSIFSSTHLYESLSKFMSYEWKAKNEFYLDIHTFGCRNFCRTYSNISSTFQPTLHRILMPNKSNEKCTPLSSVNV